MSVPSWRTKIENTENEPDIVLKRLAWHNLLKIAQFRALLKLLGLLEMSLLSSLYDIFQKIRMGIVKMFTEGVTLAFR